MHNAYWPMVVDAKAYFAMEQGTAGSAGKTKRGVPMKKTLFSAVALTTLAVMPGAALAHDGWYGGVSVGYDLDGSMDLDNPPNVANSQPFAISGTANGDNGAAVSGSLGYAFSNGFRLEGELLRGTQDFEFGSNVATTGGTNLTGVMLNALYDFNRHGTISPFIGAGVGMGRVDLVANSRDLTAPLTASQIQIDDTDTGFAWQVLAGLSLALSDRWSGDLTYRYITVPDLEFAGTRRAVQLAGGNSPTGPVKVGGSYGGDFADGGVLGLGLRYSLAPPPPPAPLVCDGRSFVVYFEHDRSNLTDQAAGVIDNEVAQIASRSCNYSTVLIQGHADTSGNPRYNIGLSQRRVTVVRDALVSRGVPGDLMSGEAFGETLLAVATPDGTKEPLNRRTEVTFSFR